MSELEEKEEIEEMIEEENYEQSSRESESENCQIKPDWVKIENDREKNFPIKINLEKVDKAKYINCTPSHIFEKFLDDEIISFVTKQSKIYYHQKTNTIDDPNLICNENIKKYLYITLYMGLNSLPSN